MAGQKAAAFMSYVHSDDRYGHVKNFHERLSSEVEMAVGLKLDIFLDSEDIKLGQAWRRRIEEALDDALFFIPMLTPGFFNSEYCRDELNRFLERERKLERDDLILPVYFFDTPLLNEEALRAEDPLALVIAARQRADWRNLRHEPFTSPLVGRMLERLAVQIRDALPRAQPSKKPAAPAKPSAQQPEAQQSKTQRSGATSGVSDEKPAPPQPTKVEPPTRVVDLMHRGDFATITEAIAKSEPGTRIIVRPGLYQEALVIDKPLEIIGEGEPGEVKVQNSAGTVILFQTTMGRVANLTIRKTGDDNYFCVDIAQGRLELEDCDISSQGNSCVAIRNGADPRLRRNRIHNSKKGCGVFIYEAGQGTLEDNEIYSNALSAVEIKGEASPTLRRNRIRDGKSGGIMVHTNGQGMIEDNDIFGNGNAGIEVKEGGNPTVRNNRIRDGKSCGIFVHTNGQGVIEDNDIFGNAYSGIVVREGSNPTVRNNRIRDGKQGGIFVHTNGQGTIEDNDIYGNALSGVEIKEGSNPTLRRNRIRDGKQNGILVQKNGQGVIEDNDIFGNAYTGVEIREGGNPTVRNNRINKNEYLAVWVYEGGSGTFEKNDLRENKKGAWLISEDSEANVKRVDNQE